MAQAVGVRLNNYGESFFGGSLEPEEPQCSAWFDASFDNPLGDITMDVIPVSPRVVLVLFEDVCPVEGVSCGSVLVICKPSIC